MPRHRYKPREILPEEKALARIVEANNKGEIELDLSNLDLTTVPSQITQRLEITSLNLYNNKISMFPIEICQLKNLEVLRIDGNKIAELPKEIEIC